MEIARKTAAQNGSMAKDVLDPFVDIADEEKLETTSLSSKTLLNNKTRTASYYFEKNNHRVGRLYK